jgi:transposase
MRRNLFWLSNAQWERIEPHLPTDVRGIERVDDRRVISGIVHVLKTGCRWCDCSHTQEQKDHSYRHYLDINGQGWTA